MSRVPTNLRQCGSKTTTEAPRLVALPWKGGIEEHVVLETSSLPDEVIFPEAWPVCNIDEAVPILELDFNHENGFRQLRARQYCLLLPDDIGPSSACDLSLCDVISTAYQEESFTPKGCVWYDHTLLFRCHTAILDSEGYEHGMLGCNDCLVGVDTDGNPVVASKTKLREGDRVGAKCNDWTRYYEGKITRANNNGTYDIKLENNDCIRNVEKHCLRPRRTRWRVLDREFDGCPKKVLFDHEGIPLFCFPERIVRWSSPEDDPVELVARGGSLWESFTIDHPVEGGRVTSSRIMACRPGEVGVFYAHNLSQKGNVWNPPRGFITCADYYRNDLAVGVWDGQTSTIHRWTVKAANRKSKRPRTDTEVISAPAPIFAVRFNMLGEIVWGGNMGFQGNVPLTSSPSTYSHTPLQTHPEWCVVEIVGAPDLLIVMTPEHAYPANALDSTPLEYMRCPIRGLRALCPPGPPKVRFCGMYWGKKIELNNSEKVKLKESDPCVCDSGLYYRDCCKKFHSEPIISECDTGSDTHVFLATVAKYVNVQHLLGIVELEMNERTIKHFGRNTTFNPNRGHFMVSGLGSMRLINDRQLCARKSSHYSMLKSPVTVRAHTVVHVVPRGNRNGRRLRPEPCGVVCTFNGKGEIMSLEYGWKGEE